VQCPPDVFDEAEDAAESVRARGAGELCVFDYTDGVAAAGALRRGALDALGRSESALAMRCSPLAPGLRARTDPPSIDQDASETTDELADGRPARERATMLGVDAAGESPRLAADALLSARGRVIVACCDAPLLARARALSFADTGAGGGARRTGVECAGETGIAAARAQSR
jgi:hypothetical protein